MTTTFNHTELFGGAITANIPSNFADVSKIRQVPDNQEVYLDKNGFTSLTFDITERVSHLSTDRDALEYHFADIVAENDTRDVRSVVENEELPNFSPSTPILALTAITKPPPSTVAAKALTPTHTDIHFTLIRLVEQSTDVVITLNTPYFAGDTGAPTPNGTEAGTRQREDEQEVGTMYHQIVMSLAIKDWGLFSGE
ncbi:hypothetical protein IMSHALPRED_005566 [Imshaugia aleurites]|uniref:Ran guanine nucleotide release factor n=1 Tax=Imshaugia aleurites TaxID=172621 RepID=A0A8H3I505_9LECA|nr:hypothetical protein IMSHALPRED_005566 [Imshaugia aleurites]